MRKPKRRAADGRRSYKIDPVSVWSVTILLCAAVFACAYVLFQNAVICAAVTAVLLIPVRRKVRKEAECGICFLPCNDIRLAGVRTQT